jgi:chromosome segregation ATPase
MLKSLARDDMPAQLNKKKELIAGLLKLVKESNASVDKATGKIVELREDKAKLCHELDLLKEEIAGWEKLREKSSASVKMLTAIIGELRDDMAKLRTENMAAIKQHHADMKEIIHAHLKKSRTMEAMKKMADERREEMKVVEAMKKELELRAQQPFMQ